jgi:hypothetical protein
MTYKVGDLVRYQLGGSKMTRTVRVQSRVADVKDGQPGFDATDLATGRMVWGYDYQIVAVLSN